MDYPIAYGSLKNLANAGHKPSIVALKNIEAERNASTPEYSQEENINALAALDTALTLLSQPCSRENEQVVIQMASKLILSGITAKRTY
jgi:hypothetical protein